MSIRVGGRVMSICREFLSNRWQRVVVDGATSEWTPRVSGVTQESVLGPLLFILCTIEMFEKVGKDYMPILMNSHYWQLFASHLTDLLLLLPLTRTWLGCGSGAVTGA